MNGYEIQDKIMLFFDSDMVNPLLKTNARRDRRFNFCYFCSLECFNFQQVVDGGLG